MKTGIVLFFCFAAWTSQAQTPVEKTYTLKSGQVVSLHFDYPELVRISTWDKNEVSVKGTVSINEGENDDAFELIQNESGNSLHIENRIRDMKSLPHRMTIVDEGKKIVFRTKADYKKYADEHGKNYEMMSWGLEMDILLEIKVPKNTSTTVKSVYGMVEVKDFVGPLSVEATYGGVDAALLEKATGEVTAETNYGQIYTNLDIKFTGDGYREKNFHTRVSAKPGQGPTYSFESKYGNVYLRRQIN
jgi:hypothetical protein